MADPWKTLGVKPGSSDEDVKRAYHDLVKKYHPDRFQDAAAKEMANEKLKEINQAYEEVTSGGAGSSRQGGAGFSENYTASGSQRFYQVRQNLQQQRVDEAERVLDQMSDRNAEWHFLRGVCYSFRGWYAMARENIAQAVNMEPNNVEYRNALSQIDNSAQGYQQFTGPFGQGRQAGANGSGCSLCDICSCMICSDCLCRGCGGC
jgi:molecular chaperone DnaJ